MTREECIRKYHHQLWGIMLECSRYKGDCAARSMLEEQLMAKIDACIAKIWSEFNKEAPLENNRHQAPAKPAKPAL
jgi:hypothetical protein